MTVKLLKRVPEAYTLRELLEYTSSVAGQRPNGSWGPIRPLGYISFSLKRRFAIAWSVFKGELDAIKWED